MAATMKTLQILKPGETVWRDAPVPVPGAGEVLVRVVQVNTCPHWDMHLLDGVPMFAGGTISYPYTPGQPGHEAVGEIAAVGPGVDGPPVGTRVACWRDAGHHRPGCYAQFVVMNQDHVLPLPAHVTWDQATSLELAMCVQISCGQIQRLDGIKGRRVGISGLGPAGLVAVQMAKAYGAEKVFGVDPVPARRELALRVGADAVFAPDASAWPAGRGGECSVYSTIDCTGLKASIEFMMDRTQKAVAIFGVLREQVSFGPQHFGGLWLIGYEPHTVEAARLALQLIADGKLDLSVLISAKLPFTRYQEGIAMLKRKEAVKVCFQPWE
jgi:threonine dehydrogenase-like Zn-dependent dehydrogenase